MLAATFRSAALTHQPMTQRKTAADRQKEATEKVVELASKIFFKQGIKSVTMDDIAHRLVMSKRTLYQLFADKEELLLACLANGEVKQRERILRFSEQGNNVLEILLKDFEYKLKRISTASLQFVRDLSKYPRAMAYLQEQRERHHSEAISFLQKGVEQGVFRPDVNFEIVYKIASLQADIIHNNMMSHFTPKEIFLNFFFVYIRGCTTEKGTAMMDEFFKKFS